MGDEKKEKADSKDESDEEAALDLDELRDQIAADVIRNLTAANADPDGAIAKDAKREADFVKIVEKIEKGSK